MATDAGPFPHLSTGVVLILSPSLCSLRKLFRIQSGSECCVECLSSQKGTVVLVVVEEGKQVGGYKS